MRNVLNVVVILMLLLQFSCAPNRGMNTTDTTSGNTNDPEIIMEDDNDVAVTEETNTGNTAMTDDSGIVVYFNEANPSNLGQYKTFTWVTPIQGMGDKSFDNDPIQQEAIQQSLIDELQRKGYTMVPDNSDILVNYYVFREPVRLTGTNNDDFADFRWNPNALRAAGDTRVHDLDTGTLLVQLANRKTGELVWQGYATGLTDGDVALIDADKVKRAVALIFDKYNN